MRISLFIIYIIVVIAFNLFGILIGIQCVSTNAEKWIFALFWVMILGMPMGYVLACIFDWFDGFFNEEKNNY
jgi:hypothetical protein